MTTEEKILKLAQRLYAKTKAGELPWEQISGKGIYQTAFPQFTIKLSTRLNSDDKDAIDYILSIVDESGAVLERASDIDMAKVFPNAKVFPLMEELYTMARRQALGVDSALDSLLTS